MSASALPPPAAASASLIRYPCHFPIKVMGLQQSGFVAAMVELVQRFDPGFDAATLEQRPSRNGNYLGLTLNVYVHSREQLDDLYRSLSSHAMVKVVL